MAGKQAKVLTQDQINRVLRDVCMGTTALRDTAMVLLSCRQGLRACEISAVRWRDFMDADGRLSGVLVLPDDAAKGAASGRTLTLSPQTAEALTRLYDAARPHPDDYVVLSRKGDNLSPNSIVNWFIARYKALGLNGCSSHSGRRTVITKAARHLRHFGGDIREAQRIAGHKDIRTTQRYIEVNEEATRNIMLAMDSLDL